MTALTATTSSLSGLLILMLPFFTTHILAQDPTTVPIFLPVYEATQWSRLRGSIISSNDVETLYTIFCSPTTQTTTALDDAVGECVIAGDDKLPFTFFEGPSTLYYAETIESSFTLNLGCNLAGTTAATCSGYTSIDASFSLGPIHGPVESSSPPKTLTGSRQVQWGVLTLAQPPLTSTASGGEVVTYYPPSSSVRTITLTSEGSGSATVTETVASESSSSGSNSDGSNGLETGAPASTTPSRAAKLGGWGVSLLLGGVVFVLVW